MNLSAMTTAEAPKLPFVVERIEASHPAVMTAWQDLYSHQMDRAIGIEKESLAIAMRLQSSMIDQLGQAGLPPALCGLFEAAALAVKSCLELQLSWLAMIAPGCVMLQDSSSPLFALESLDGHSPAEEEYERCMDIAIGSLAA